MQLTVTLTPDLGNHGDLILTIPALGVHQPADTYYFALAAECLESDDNHLDVQRCVASLLQYWRDRAADCAAGQTIYLPFDISDQYTGCLRVTRQDDDVSLAYGYSLTEGYAVSLPDPGTFCYNVNDFVARPEAVASVPREHFLNAITAAVAVLQPEG